MRLHVGEGAAEQLGHALDRQLLDHVDELAAAVVALARQPFGILVGQHRALRLEHRAADDVLRRDQLDLVALAAQFAADGVGNFRIAFAERGGEKPLRRDRCTLRDRHALRLVFAPRDTAGGRPTLADSILAGPAQGLEDCWTASPATSWEIVAQKPATFEVYEGFRRARGTGARTLANSSWSPGAPGGRPCRRYPRGTARPRRPSPSAVM